ncbi:S8 family peptidase [Thalassomonas actiniarum]|uniref:S8 family serine peptidase n=1 Tax=Thalassomonas actiniarum TaxID=485447 RepID=A0AAE9YNL6_9GAMM|nr:S8 family serine peptidase [Thalassomonas actiniarum]WDD98160.1 S8 family serine peptidase [Thalassomonas actiniarum]
MDNMVKAFILSTLIASQASAKDINQAQALNQLDVDVDYKLSEQSLDNLLAQQVNTVIIEVEDDWGAGTAQRLQSFASNRKNKLISSLGLSKKTLSAISAQTVSSNPASEQGILANADNSIRLKQDYNHLPFMVMEVSTRSALVELLNNNHVYRVHENQLKYPAVTESLPVIKQPVVAKADYTGEGTYVAVIDSGINYLMEPFGCTGMREPEDTCKIVHGRSWRYTTDDPIDPDRPDSIGHGTNVAGIIAAVAPATKFLSYKVFNGGGAPDDWIFDAIDGVIEDKIEKNFDIVAVNLSLGGDSLHSGDCVGSAYDRAFERLMDNGIIPVVSAGNEGELRRVGSPACARHSLTVGASFKQISDNAVFSTCNSGVVTDVDTFTCFSNRSESVEIVAPGSWITAAGITMSGTSQAAPHVSGAVAVLRSPQILADEPPQVAMDIITQSATPMTDVETGLPYRRLDLENAANQALEYKGKSRIFDVGALIPIFSLLLN